MFVDLAKSWELNNHVMTTMMPRLIPGGLLIQQDYVHYNEYWIHIEMERYREHFEHLGFVYGASAWYRCLSPVPTSNVPSQRLSYSQKMDYLEAARDRAIPAVRATMLTAAAKCAVENNDFAKASELLSKVSTEPCGDTFHSFHGTAATGLKAVTSFLNEAQSRPRPSVWSKLKTAVGMRPPLVAASR